MDTNGGTCENGGADGAAAARTSGMPQPKKLFRFASEKGKEELVALAPTGTLAAIRCKADRCFRLVSVPEGKPVVTLPMPEESLPRVQTYFTRDGLGLLCLLPGDEGCGVTLWDAKTGGALWQTTVTEEARRPAVTASFLCMTRKNGYVSVYSLQNGRFVNAFRAHRPICDYDWESPDACVDLYALGGDGLLSCGWDGWLRQWRLCEDGVVAEQRNLICNFGPARTLVKGRYDDVTRMLKPIRAAAGTAGKRVLYSLPCEPPYRRGGDSPGHGFGQEHLRPDLRSLRVGEHGPLRPVGGGGDCRDRGRAAEPADLFLERGNRGAY